jgi:hypothetical protein
MDGDCTILRKQRKIKLIMLSWALRELVGRLFVGTNTGTVLLILKCLLLYSAQAKFKIETIGFTTRFREKIKPVEKHFKIAKAAQ